MKTTSPPNPRVVLRAPNTALAWLTFSKTVLDGLTNHKALFPTPNPPLAQLTTDIDALDAAETATHSRTRGAAATRDGKLKVVREDLETVRTYVQGLVNADPDHAAEIAQAAGLGLKKSTSRSKAVLSAKPNAKASGAVDLAAKVGGVKSSHEWQYSTDGGKTWSAAQTTLQARTTVTGLTPGSTVVFRHRAITKSGPDPWSQAITLIVT